MTDREAMKLALEALEKDPAPLNAINNAKCFLYSALEQPDPVEAAVLAEREACAKAAYNELAPSSSAMQAAKAIKARGDKHD